MKRTDPGGGRGALQLLRNRRNSSHQLLDDRLALQPATSNLLRHFLLPKRRASRSVCSKTTKKKPTTQNSNLLRLAKNAPSRNLPLLLPKPPNVWNLELLPLLPKSSFLLLLSPRLRRIRLSDPPFDLANPIHLDSTQHHRRSSQLVRRICRQSTMTLSQRFRCQR